METKTLKEWLKLLPLSVRLKYMENLRIQKNFHYLKQIFEKEFTISASFLWLTSKEGFEYWNKVEDKYILNK